MKITVTTAGSSLNVIEIEVSEDLELENFKALCEFETTVPAQDMMISFGSVPLTDNKRTLKSYGLKNGDIVLVQKASQQQQERTTQPTMQRPRIPTGSAAGAALPFNFDFSSIKVPGSSGNSSASASSSNQSQGGQQQQPQQQNTGMENVEKLRTMLLNDPYQLSQLKEHNPRLAEALLSGKPEEFKKVLEEQQRKKAEKEMERIRMINADPFDAEAQKYIAEEIRMQNVNDMMESAMEHQPESFGQVHMLYIDCMVNGHHVKAFVDSGAQTTLMSSECARRCNIMRLVDERWAGIAKGVGTQKIIGRVHIAQIQIGRVFLPSSFAILEDQRMDMLLGLDMLKRHQCVIDLKHNKLVIGTTGTETPFLPESELPMCARLNTSDGEPDATNNTAGGSDAKQEQTFPASHIQTLLEMGLSEEQAVAALRQANGDPNQAAAIHFANSLKGP